MWYPRLLAMALVALPCCAGKGTADLIDGGGNASSGSTGTGATGTGTAIGTSTSAAGSGTTSGAGSNTGGFSSSGTAGTSSSSGGSTGIGPPACIWANDVCALASCSNASIGESCALPDGGLGSCHGGQCSDLTTDPDNCGFRGVRCPPAVGCVNGSCAIDCVDGGGCPSGYSCQPASGCYAVDCSVAADDDYCANPGPPTGYFCCGGMCLGDSAANCGGCGVTCPPTTACLNARCVPVNACQAGASLIVTYQSTTCLLPSGDAGQCCGGVCADTSQADHCGFCSVACADGGSCVPGGSGYNECSGDGCATDADCPQGFTCDQGGCRLADCTAATEGFQCESPSVYGLCCSGVCVDFQSNAHCGACGISCDTGQMCANDSCVVLAPPSMQAGDYAQCRLDDGGLGRVCSGTCSEVATDPVNCGSCSVGCSNGAICDGGVCLDDAGAFDYCVADSDCPQGTLCNSNYSGCSPPTCGSGNQLCSGDGGGWCCGTECVDIFSDPENCGGCANLCPVALGAVCTNGGCSWPDGGALDYFESDAGCPPGFQCFAGGGTPPTCEFGQRACAFGPMAQPYEGTCCNGTCVNTLIDPLNCNGCGIECPSGYCANPWPGGCIPSPLSQGCAQSCGPGTTCAQGWCVDSLCNGPTLYCLAKDGAAGICCSPQSPVQQTVACADLSNDPSNCGTCGLVCPAGTACVNGLCNGLAACGPGHAGSYCNLDAGPSFLCCPGLGCIDTSNDPQNCGACNSSCGSGQICDAGRCGPP
jgi:hypothetical protein